MWFVISNSWKKYDFEILNRDFNFLKMYIKEKDLFF